MKIGIIGECMVELFDQKNGQCQLSFGGDTLNTAIYMARCAADTAVHYVTDLGDDPISQQMIDAWQHEGVLTEYVGRMCGEVPGLYMIQTDDVGERSFLYWRDKAPAKRTFNNDNTENLCQVLMGFDWLYFTGITLAILEPAGRERLIALLADFRAQGGKVAFDVNHRPKLWAEDEAMHWSKLAYQNCDLALPSVEDEMMLWGLRTPEEIIQQLGQFGCEEVVLKCGENPCLAGTPEQYASYPVQTVDVVLDSTAAGDSFNGAYMAARIQGASISDAVKSGQNIASQVISQQGAIVSVVV